MIMTNLFHCMYVNATSFTYTDFWDEKKSYSSDCIPKKPLRYTTNDISSICQKLIKCCTILAGVFYNVKNRLSFIASKSLSKNLSNENKHTMFQENWHFNLRFVLKTVKYQCLFSLLRFFDNFFDLINDLFLTL